MVKLAGGTPIFVPLRPTDPSDETSASWKLDMKEFEGLFNTKTKAVILNSPNNPLGKVFTREELTVRKKDYLGICYYMNINLNGKIEVVYNTKQK